MRSAEEYAKDLVSSWVYEDSVFRYLSKFFDISLEGGDKHRKILDHSKVSSTSDYVIKSEGQEVAIELINSYTNYWKKSQRIDLRDNKFTKLRNDKSILLCVDLFNKEFYVVDLNDKNLKHEYTPFHKPYGKPAYQIDISDISIHELTMPKMKDILNEIVTEER